MKNLFITACLLLLVTGCTTSAFLGGSGDKCQYAAVIHSGFVVFAGSTSKTPVSVIKGERAAYAGVANACASGSLNSITLTRLVDAYASAVADWKSP